MRVLDVPGHLPDLAENVISNDVVRQMLEELGIDYLVTIPESVFEVLLKDILKRSSIKILQVCRESEGMSLCSGLTYGGKKAVLLCSFKGLYNSVDSLLGTAVRTQASFLILFSESSAQAKRAASDLEEGVYTANILKDIKVPYYEVSSNAEVP